MDPSPPQGRLDDPTFVAALGDWSSAPGGSLASRLALALRRAVVGGLLPVGGRLPPERRMAELLSVSRSTVATALDELRADDLVTSRQGSGTTITGPGAPSAHPRGAVDQLLDHGPGIDLAAATPGDASHLPPLTLSTDDLVGVVPGHGYEPAGLARGREAVAHHLSARGLRTTAGQIHLTTGAQQALDLTLASLTAPGDRVVVEEPTYPGLLDLLRRHRLGAVPVEGDRRGPDPDAFGAALRHDRVRLAYLMPGGHNPTGRVTGRGRRGAIADALDGAGVAAIEDDVLADLAFDGRRGPSLAQLCRTAPVVVVGSLSKSAWGGLRFGWLRATEPVISDTVRRRTTTDLAPSVPSQLLGVRLLPDLDDIAERRRRVLASAASSLIRRLATELPTWEAEPPDSGLSLWIRLPVGDAHPFVQLARRHGVHVAAGSTASARRGPDPHVRICFDRPAPVLDEGLVRLRRAWQSAHVI